jgi:colanic acid/amylovoran biosynthesis glycosyltransferase
VTTGAEGRLRVVHSTLRWLPLTEVWLETEVRQLPPWVESRVVCEARANPDQFRGDGVRAVSDRGRAYLLWNACLRRSGIRRHAGVMKGVTRTHRPHLVHSHFGDVGWRDHRFTRRRRLPHVVSFYGSDLTMLPRAPRWRRRYRELFAEAALVLCEGPHMAETLRALGCPEDRLQVHRLGVDVGSIPFRARARPEGRALRVLMAASFREKKGLPDAVEALGLLVRDGREVSATLIGGGRDAEALREARRIHDAIGRHGLGGRIRLLGYVPHARLAEEAERHDVFLSPSRTAANGDAEGGAPVAIIEMAAAGLPVVSTRHCDIPFVLAEPNRRLLAPERDPEALAAAITDLLQADWGVLTAANRALVAREMDGPTQAGRLADLYARVARHAGPCSSSGGNWPPGGVPSR